jgi:hypothetical protein
LLLALFARKEFAPEVMTQLGHGGLPHAGVPEIVSRRTQTASLFWV